jgi:hypothetical protein
LTDTDYTKLRYPDYWPKLVSPWEIAGMIYKLLDKTDNRAIQRAISCLLLVFPEMLEEK